MMVCRDQVNAAVTTTAAVPSGANLPNAGSLASLSTSNCAKLPVLGRLAPYRRHSVASTCQEPAVWRRWNPARRHLARAWQLSVAKHRFGTAQRRNYSELQRFDCGHGMCDSTCFSHFIEGFLYQ